MTPAALGIQTGPRFFQIAKRRRPRFSGKPAFPAMIDADPSMMPAASSGRIDNDDSSHFLSSHPIRDAELSARDNERASVGV